MTARTSDALASALPAGIRFDLWNARQIAEFQAERLAEAGYVLVHTAPDEATVERLARVGAEAEGFNWEQVFDEPKESLRQNVRAVLAALAGTSAQARHTADEKAGGGEDG